MVKNVTGHEMNKTINYPAKKSLDALPTSIKCQEVRDHGEFKISEVTNPNELEACVIWLELLSNMQGVQYFYHSKRNWCPLRLSIKKVYELENDPSQSCTFLDNYYGRTAIYCDCISNNCNAINSPLHQLMQRMVKEVTGKEMTEYIKYPMALLPYNPKHTITRNNDSSLTTQRGNCAYWQACVIRHAINDGGDLVDFSHRCGDGCIEKKYSQLIWYVEGDKSQRCTYYKTPTYRDVYCDCITPYCNHIYSPLHELMKKMVKNVTGHEMNKTINYPAKKSLDALPTSIKCQEVRDHGEFKISEVTNPNELEACVIWLELLSNMQGVQYFYHSKRNWCPLRLSIKKVYELENDPSQSCTFLDNYYGRTAIYCDCISNNCNAINSPLHQLMQRMVKEVTGKEMTEYIKYPMALLPYNPKHTITRNNDSSLTTQRGNCAYWQACVIRHAINDGGDLVDFSHRCGDGCIEKKYSQLIWYVEGDKSQRCTYYKTPTYRDVYCDCITPYCNHIYSPLHELMKKMVKNVTGHEMNKTINYPAKKSLDALPTSIKCQEVRDHGEFKISEVTNPNELEACVIWLELLSNMQGVQYFYHSKRNWCPLRLSIKKVYELENDPSQSCTFLDNYYGRTAIYCDCISNNCNAINSPLHKLMQRMVKEVTGKEMTEYIKYPMALLPYNPKHTIVPNNGSIECFDDKHGKTSNTNCQVTFSLIDEAGCPTVNSSFFSGFGPSYVHKTNEKATDLVNVSRCSFSDNRLICLCSTTACNKDKNIIWKMLINSKFILKSDDCLNKLQASARTIIDKWDATKLTV